MTTRTTLKISPLLFLAILGAACGVPPQVAETSQALFVNGGFETGAAGSAPTSWTVQTFLNPGITVQTPQTRAGLNFGAGGAAKTTELNGVNQADPDLGALASLRWSRNGNQCAITNQHGNNQNVNSLSQTMTIGASDVDPVDGQVHVRAIIAPVLQNPAHTPSQQPYYYVQLTNTTQGTLLYSDFNLSGLGIPWKCINCGTVVELDYTDWQLIDIAGTGGKILMGDIVNLEIIGAGCSLGAHFGEVYVDDVGATIPGITVEGTGPAQANAGSNITYAFTWRNGSGGAETAVVIDVTTPANTTFQSITPPAGATCVTPVVGGTGTITCTFTNPVAAGVLGNFTVTVNINAAASGQIVLGNYDIHSTQETVLLGPKITTLVGCAKDVDCSAGLWCHESAPNACDPTLPNGTAMPSDPPHSGPTLNGTCTAPAATLVCTSKVCDTTDNKCGYLNGDGPCNAGNAGVVCRSGVCDPDGKCGYANGDGPCTAANGGTVCRSAVCSSNGTCMPAGGCNVDADCTGGTWCNESVHTCTATLPNGTAMPSDPPHTSPTLNAMCTAPAATLVCTSKVCDTSDNECGYLNGDGSCNAGNAGVVCRSGACDPDGKCGYADGDGPCTMVDGGTVCRSGACSANGTCEPAGGCNVDADCAGGKWCNESAHSCTAKLPNGTSLPNDPPHSGPTLNGMCTAPAATLTCVSGVCDGADNRCGYLNGDGSCNAGNAGFVCRSGVCDPDGKCGYADGDGPCTMADGGTVCRSGACSANGTCEPAGGCNVDADCAGSKWCDESAHSCTSKLANGSPLPNDPPHSGPTLNGMCTAPAATLTCASGVCDKNDDKCGYAVGDGPCTMGNGGTVCRSGACSADGTCAPAGGCNVDADCTGGKWCNESAHSCTAKLPNGSPIPSDPPHTGPTLDGTCSAPSAVLTCASGVCDPNDNQCGLADGDGPCTAGDPTMVCRSGACNSNGTCGPISGCTLDTDCVDPSHPVCDPTTHMCTPATASGGSPRAGFTGGGFCAVGSPGAAGGDAVLVLFVLALLALAVRARRTDS
ncbi:MAG: hypothetical protein JWM53_608 [bacterium]|nr:hypothetical protein [bacterium]